MNKRDTHGTRSALCALLLGLSALLSTEATLADTQVFSSGTQPVALIELYTSEGCSSCPPAEAWISSLKNDPGLWKDRVPVAFHVDYWDYLGWKDSLASPAYSARQARYVQSGTVSQSYTPGFVINGREWRRWFRDRVLPSPINQQAGQLRVELEGNRLRARYNKASKEPLHLNLAILGVGVRTRIKAGENRGMLADQDFVVLGHSLTESSDGRWNTVLPPMKEIPHRRLALAAWVSRIHDQTRLQATGGWISIPRKRKPL